MARELEAVDLIRERMGVGYAEAHGALEASGGDVVAALAYLETRRTPAEQELARLVAAVVKEVKQSCRKRSIEAIRVKYKDQLVAEVQVALGGAEAMGLALLAGLVEGLRIELD